MWPVLGSPSRKTAVTGAAEFAGNGFHTSLPNHCLTASGSPHPSRVCAQRALRGSQSTGIRSTWPSQRDLCSVISSSIEGELFLPNTIRRTSKLLIRCSHQIRAILRRYRWSNTESLLTSSARSGQRIPNREAELFRLFSIVCIATGSDPRRPMSSAYSMSYMQSSLKSPNKKQKAGPSGTPTPFLFTFVIDEAMRRTTKVCKSPVLRREEGAVFLDELTKVAPHLGMHFAPTKCKVMLLDMQSLTTPPKIQGEVLEVGEWFTCLSSDCSVTDEVNSRVYKARAAFANLIQLWRQSCASLNLKGRVYQATEHSPCGLLSENLKRGNLKASFLLCNGCLQHQKLRWLGHVLHMPNHRLSKRTLFSVPDPEQTTDMQPYAAVQASQRTKRLWSISQRYARDTKIPSGASVVLVSHTCKYVYSLQAAWSRCEARCSSGNVGSTFCGDHFPV
ncbi:hypothetical protein T265_07687 [Opisthorchis viverrini]|uniref:Uncharacterized protein n=1 Tax=Opisthorchis viverrini TaxID=6198 RepID=A0A074ZGG2_OPIVI|nr:hypothetical protein T265_07687 [Opisthorchis viverrini]KER24737.1 hypothetical protein T265_07687 [Opisthorchis viverrini]